MIVRKSGYTGGYTHWRGASGEPNNCCGGQHYGFLYPPYGGEWDDGGVVGAAWSGFVCAAR